MTGLTLDTGALIAFERQDRKIIELIGQAVRRRYDIVVPAAVVARVWRDPRRKVRLVRLLGNEVVDIEPLDAFAAKQVGQLCGVRKTTDVVDASVVLCARTRKHRIVTSDPDDLRRLDPNLELIEV